MKSHGRCGDFSGTRCQGMRLLPMLLLLLLLYILGNVTAATDESSSNDNSNNAPTTGIPCQDDTCGHGTCNDTSGTAVCTCERGWIGVSCTEGIPCRNDTCGHGTCNDTSGTAVCTCERGWTGVNCTEGIPCQDDTCSHGTCNDTSGTAVCTCDRGWTGFNCTEGIPCQDNTCDHGTCNDTSGTAVCICDEEWTGFSCTEDKDECALNVCKNQAYCENYRGSYECVCRGSWKGTNCDQDIDECGKDPNPCPDANDKCVNTMGSFSCVCNQGYERLQPQDTCKLVVILPIENSKTQRLWGDDEVFGPFFIPAGFGTPVQISYFISTNGYITFNTKFSHLTMPEPDSPQLASLFFLAPYWADIDIPQSSTTSGLYHASLSLKDTFDDNETAALFEEYTNLTDLNDFQPIFISVVTWMNVLPYKAEDFPDFQPATFQVVMATDGHRMKGRVGWRSTWSRLDDFDVSVYHRLTTGMPTPWPSLTDIPRRTPFASSDTSTDSVAPCVEWLGNEGQQFQQTEAANDRVACPCSLSQAEADPLFVVASSSSSERNCANTATSRVYSHLTAKKTICCYGQDDMITIYPWKAPDLKDATQKTVAANGFEECCDKSKHVLLCDQFTRLFPVDNCSLYTPPQTALLWSYGHIMTVDEVYYMFNGWAEYLLLRVPANSQDSDVVSIEIQGRSVKGDVDNFNITVFTAFAIKYGNALPFEVHVDTGRIKLYVNGQEKTENNAGLGSDIVLTMSQTAHELEVFFPSGVTLKVVAAAASLSLSVSAVYLGPPEDVKGLLVGRSMGAGFAAMTPEQKFSAADVWALTESASLFAYNLTGQGDNFSTYQHRDFMPSFLPATAEALLSALNDTDKMVQGQEYCGVSVACLQDFYVTNDIDRAVTTKRTEEKLHQMQEILGKQPPKFITLDPWFNMTMKEGVFIHDILVQPEATNASQYPVVTLSMMSTPNITLNYTFAPGEVAGKWVLTWYLDNQLREPQAKVDLTFSANSTVTGMISHYKPALVLCACERPETECDYFTVRHMVDIIPPMSGGLYLADCKCDNTKGGRFCQEDVNVCDVCYDVTLCNNSVTTDAMCKCPQGYEGDGMKCYEKDECLQGNVCEQDCQNTVGSFACSCRDGYTLIDSTKCQDKNECENDTSHICTDVQFCENMEGTYLCRCRPHYGGKDCSEIVQYRYGGSIVFRSDPELGQGWSEELEQPHSSEFQRLAGKIEGIFVFILKEENIEFVSVIVVSFRLDSVPTSTDGQNPVIVANFEVGTAKRTTNERLQNASRTAFNPDCVSSQCKMQGDDNDPNAVIYGVDKTGPKFDENYDLCASDRTNECHDTSTTCETIEGTIHCQCRQGYTRWDLFYHTCQDVDECQPPRAADLCGNFTSNDTECVNTDGSYYCVCPDSYTWHANTKRCVVVTLKDACTEKQPCKNGGECVNTVDHLGYACRCTDGWTGPDCTEEDGEAERYKENLIIVASVLGAACLILLIVIIVVVCVLKRRSSSHWPESSPEGEPKYTHYHRRQTNPNVVPTRQSTNGSSSMQRYSNPAFDEDGGDVYSKRM